MRRVIATSAPLAPATPLALVVVAAARAGVCTRTAPLLAATADQWLPKSLDRQVADKHSKGPKAAHPLPVYKPMHKLHQSARWKAANVVPTGNDGVGKQKETSLAQSHDEGRVDVTGHYRDWAYGEDRRYGNYLGVTLFCISASVFAYTVSSLRSDTWEVPEPLMMQPPPVAAKSASGDAKNPILQPNGGMAAPSVAGRK